MTLDCTRRCSGSSASALTSSIGAAWRATSMPTPGVSDIRFKAYAGVELLLDMCHSARSLANIDLESLLIYFCVMEATLRPLVASGAAPAEGLTHEITPDQYQGAISMLQVSDKLGIPRETARRKIKSLVRKGMLKEDQAGRIQASSNLSNPTLRKAADATYDAARRYLDRLGQYNIPSPDGGPPA